MTIALFLPAGTLTWPAGWIWIILVHGWLLAGIVLLLRQNPGLLRERLSFSQRGQKAWDKAFLLLFEVLLFAWLVLMPLDAVRFRWSQLPLGLQLFGAAAVVGSFLVISLTFRENPFLSPAVRVQQERGQMVISTGPYHYVRHPMYAGGLLLFLGTPLMLGSLYGLLLSLVFVAGGAARAVMEERALGEELPGYAGYLAQVKYRLIPGIW
jgi:protein-S-isoprenylcysteine O-methyltransferase Ste14